MSYKQNKCNYLNSLQGLNRKAQITLDNVYPRRIGTNTLIKDLDELLQMNFSEKLRKITVKKDAKFVDYRPETGSWVFKVDHFSRYGYNDSDEETESGIQEGASKKNVDGTKKLDPKADGRINNVEQMKLDYLKKNEQSKDSLPVSIFMWLSYYVQNFSISYNYVVLYFCYFRCPNLELKMIFL